MKNFLLIVMVASMCDSCENQGSEKSRFRSFGINDKGNATSEYDSFDLKSRDRLPEFELPETRIKVSGMVNEQDINNPYQDFKIYYYSIN